MTSLGCHGVSNHCQFVCFIQQLVPASHNRIIKVLRYRYSPTINTANHLISLSLILSVMNELPCQWFYTIQRKAFRGIFTQLLRIIPVSYILDLFIISTGSADAQVPPAWPPAYTRLHFNWSVWLNMFYKNINILFHLEEIWASPNLLISYTLCLLIIYHHFKHIQPFPIIVIMKHRNLKKKNVSIFRRNRGQ